MRPQRTYPAFTNRALELLLALDLALWLAALGLLRFGKLCVCSALLGCLGHCCVSSPRIGGFSRRNSGGAVFIAEDARGPRSLYLSSKKKARRWATWGVLRGKV